MFILPVPYPKGKVEISSMNFIKRFACRPNELITIELPRKVLIDSNELFSNKKCICSIR